MLAYELSVRAGLRSARSHARARHAELQLWYGDCWSSRNLHGFCVGKSSPRGARNTHGGTHLKCAGGHRQKGLGDSR
jgi:hypothetical protein